MFIPGWWPFSFRRFVITMKTIVNVISCIDPLKFYLCAAIFFGFTFLAVMPPFQVADEPGHFCRAWQISEGGFMAKRENNRIIADLPASVGQFITPFLRQIWANEIRFGANEWRDREKIKVNAGSRATYDINTTALYSVICYVPQSLAIFIFRTFDLPLLYIFYLARIFALCFWITCACFSIRLLPYGKWLFVFLALLPTTIMQNLAISADVVTNGAAFLFIASCLRLSVEGNVLTPRRCLALFVLVIVLCLAKAAYLPLLLLLFLVRTSNCGSFKNKFMLVTIYGSAGCLAAILWTRAVSDLYISYADYNPEYVGSAALVNGADAHRQMEFLASDPLFVFGLLGRSLVSSLSGHITGYMGTFGWNDRHIGEWLAVTAYIVILVIACTDGKNPPELSWRHKLLFLSIVFIIVCLIILSMYATWIPVGYNVVAGFPGRYLIPVYPLFFMVFLNKIKIPAIGAFLTIIMSVILFLASLQVLSERYWPPV